MGKEENSMTEEWRDIPEYDGRYQISNYGRVRSIPYVRYQQSKHPGVMMYKHHPGKIMTPTGNGNGYLIIGLRNGKHRKNYYIHRLVAEAFIPNPDGLKEVNHIDYNKGNNIVTNLEWVSRKENLDWSHGRGWHTRSEQSTARLTNIGMRYISIRNGKYRVSIHNKRLGYQFDKCYITLEEAIAAKEQFIHGKEYFAAR